MNRLVHRQCYAVDMRGHGLSSKPDPPYAWNSFGEDLAMLARELHLEGAIGVGHSMGGHSLAAAAAAEPGMFAKLLLIDPVILPRSFYGSRSREPHYARKRKNKWSSDTEMFERFRDRQPFRDWDIAVLRDYCHWGLVADGDDFVLACPPEIEASIYENSSQPSANLYGKLERITAAVTVMRAVKAIMGSEGPGIDMAASPTAPDLARVFRNGKDVPVQLSHFIPMEAPALVADIVREL